MRSRRDSGRSQNSNGRLASIEQKLQHLAERFDVLPTRQEFETLTKRVDGLPTRQEIEGLATRQELKAEHEATRRHIDIRFEEVRQRFNILAEGYEHLSDKIDKVHDDLKQDIAGVDRRVMRLEVHTGLIGGQQ